MQIEYRIVFTDQGPVLSVKCKHTTIRRGLIGAIPFRPFEPQTVSKALKRKFFSNWKLCSSKFSLSYFGLKLIGAFAFIRANCEGIKSFNSKLGIEDFNWCNQMKRRLLKIFFQNFDWSVKRSVSQTNSSDSRYRSDLGHLAAPRSAACAI